MLFLMAFGIFLLFHCTKLEDDFYLYTKVENASEFDDVVEVRLMMFSNTDGFIELARGKWHGKGFKMKLPKAIDPNYLNTYLFGSFLPSDVVDDPPSTLTITGEKNVKIVENASFYGYNKYGERIACFSPYHNSDLVIDANFTYADSNITLSGYIVEEGIGAFYDIIGNPNFYEWKITTNISIEWNKGWNFSHYTSDRPIKPPGYIPSALEITTLEWATTPNSIIKWRGWQLSNY